jgi:hypothetical protein
MTQLKRRCNLSGGEDLQWFSGIEVHRDHLQNLIWFSQSSNSSYIDKAVKLTDTKQPDETPMAKIELFPYEERVCTGRQVVRTYQRKIGSLLYAAVTYSDKPQGPCHSFQRRIHIP